LGGGAIWKKVNFLTRKEKKQSLVKKFEVK